jgi:glutamate racemase
MSHCAPIAILDSGTGGLTVARQIRRHLPAEDLLYFGDTARLPYGNKSASTVIGFVRQIVRFLLEFHPKHIVIACNTATALALNAIRVEFPGLSISGVIEPGARAALTACQRSRPLIGIMATSATVRSAAYDHAIAAIHSDARLVSQAAPLLAPIIEDGRRDNDPLLRMALAHYLAPLLSRKLDVLVLGCTHYPIVRDAISAAVGQKVAVIDSADQCAQDVAQRLRSLDLLRPAPRGDAAHRSGRLRCFVTDDPPRFAAHAREIMGMAVRRPTLVPISQMARLDSLADARRIAS